MSAAAEARAPSTGLVLPPEHEPPRRLLQLRRAEAWRLLKAHAATGDLRIARPLAELARSAPDDAVDVLADPVASVLARCGRHDEAADAWALELARRGALPGRYVARGSRIANVALGVTFSGARIALSSRTIELDGRAITLDALDRNAFVDLRPGIHFALHDANPLAMLEAHPDKQGNALSLGGRDRDEWITSLRGALAVIERHLPGVIDELRALSMLLVPVGYEPEKHLSASYREYVGACYLTLHPDVRTMAEAIVHEHQHNKANLASYHDALIENALGTMVRSPVRPDLRPIWGVLLAVHAFVPVAELYRRMREAGDASVTSRLADVIARNDEGLRTVREHARPTRIGAALIEELEALHATHLALGLARPAGVSWEG